MNLILWCAISISGVPVKAESIILAIGKYTYAVKNSEGIIVVHKEKCSRQVGEFDSKLPLNRRKK